jgi:hypothetical protein
MNVSVFLPYLSGKKIASFLWRVVLLSVGCPWRVMLLSVGCPVVQHFSTFSHKRHDIREKKVLYIKCVFLFSLQLLSEVFF